MKKMILALTLALGALAGCTMDDAPSLEDPAADEWSAEGAAGAEPVAEAAEALNGPKMCRQGRCSDGLFCCNIFCVVPRPGLDCRPPRPRPQLPSGPEGIEE